MERRVGVNLLPDPAFKAGLLPLLEEGLVDAIEWMIDQAFGNGEQTVEPWVDALLDLFAAEDALYGHGVWLSVLSADWTPRQERWMERLGGECGRRRYRHVSEHFGFMTAGRFVQGTLLPVPRVDEAVAVGIDRLRRLAAASGRPVGLENMALALGPADALEQGRFLREVLEPAGGFLLLDLHNLYTQAVNLELDPLALLESYPLDRARELHVSGGSIVDGVRMDSHDDDVPDAVFPLVSQALERCPNVEVVFLERRSETLDTPGAPGAPGAIDRWQADYRRLHALVKA